MPARWHASSAWQVTVAVGAPQAPAWQVWPLVQASPSSQAAPSGEGWDAEQVPEATSQVRAWWHWSRGGQSASVEQAQVLAVGVHWPDRQASPVVHERPSSQEVPSA